MITRRTLYFGVGAAVFLGGHSVVRTAAASEVPGSQSGEMQIRITALLNDAGWNCRSIYPEEPGQPEYSHMQVIRRDEGGNSVVLRTTTFEEGESGTRTVLTYLASMVVDEARGRLTVGSNTATQNDTENNIPEEEDPEVIEILFDVVPAAGSAGEYLIRGFTTIDDETAQLICTPVSAQ